MSAGLYTHTTRATGTILTAAIYNTDHQNHVTNQNPEMTGGASDDVAAMQAVVDPGPVGTESLAGSLAGELHRLRFKIKEIIGDAHWYSAVPVALSGVASAVSGLLAGDIALPKKVSFTGIISPAQITANQNDYNPTSLADASVLRLSLDAARTITGLQGGASGRQMLIRNISAFVLTLASEGAASSAANRFSFDHDILVWPGQAIQLDYSATTSRWHRRGDTLPQGMPGCRNRVITVTSATALSIAADSAILEHALGHTVKIGAISIASVAITTVAGATGDGLDTGAEAASTWYYVWLIYNPTTGDVAGLLSASATAPTLPSGYTYKFRIGTVRNDASSNLYRTLQRGDTVYYRVGSNPVSDYVEVDGGSGSGTMTVNNFAPTTVAKSVMALARCAFADDSNQEAILECDGAEILRFKDSRVDNGAASFTGMVEFPSAGTITYDSDNASFSFRVMGWREM